MATHLKFVFLTCLLLLVVLMEDVKPALAKKKPSVKKRVKTLEEIVGGLKEEMEALEEKVNSMVEPESSVPPPTTPPTTPGPPEPFKCPSCKPDGNNYSQESCDNNLVDLTCKPDQSMCIAARVASAKHAADIFFRGCISENNYEKAKKGCESLPNGHSDVNCQVGRCSTSGCLAKLGHDE